MASDKKELPLRRSILIRGDIRRVWEALIDPAMTEKYAFGLRVSSDWKVGSPVLWKGTHEGREIIRKGRVLRIEWGRSLQITDFDALGGLEDIPSNYTRVTYELTEESGQNTRLDIAEDNFGRSSARFDDACRFWDATLPKLKTLIEE